MAPTDEPEQDHSLLSGKSECVIGFADLVGQLKAIIQESGDPEGFDAAVWMSRWHNDPVPALGGMRPIDLMDTVGARSRVHDTRTVAERGLCLSQTVWRIGYGGSSTLPG